MITKAKVNVYIQLDGDIDGYARCGRSALNVLTEDEFIFIDKTVSEIGLIRKNLASESFRQKHEEKLKGFDCSDTYEMLKAYEADN